MSTPSTTEQGSTSLSATLAAQYNALVDAGRIPVSTLLDRFGHWGLRIPLAGVLWTNGVSKFPDVFLAPGDYGVPAALFILTGFAEVLAALAFIIGGVIESWRPKMNELRLAGDILTRASGASGVAVLLGIIFVLFGGTTIDDPHLLILGCCFYFALRGNTYGRS